MAHGGDLAEHWDARVLLVDDQEAITSLLSVILSDAGLRFVTAINDSREVAPHLADYPPDLVILDLQMPHVDGYELLDVISRHAAGSFMPVLVLTGDTAPAAAHRALGLGAHDFVTKPLDAVEVILRVRNLLRTRSLHQQLRINNLLLRGELHGIQTSAVEDLSGKEARRTRIAGSIATGGPRTVFQPMVELATERIAGYEALSRFDSRPIQGPDRWFADALDVGLSVDLESQAARTALSQVSRLHDDQFMTVNVSPAVVMADLRSLLGEDVPWERIVIELTEHVPIEDYPGIVARLAPLRAAGARLAIDDTGAGFASLRHILRLAPDILKLDISICRGVDRDPSRRALAAALAIFAQDIGAEIVAEGIETPEERQTLLDLGIQYGQGYLLGRPRPFQS
jgi:EAL domain-containing protein (putative c-di-GMP-specific phosphodiesterase class I)/FixJ family two-component response regulator